MTVFTSDILIPAIPQESVAEKKPCQRKALLINGLNPPLSPVEARIAPSVFTSPQIAVNEAGTASQPVVFTTVLPTASADRVSGDTPPIALVVSDLHLSPGVPAARIDEPDWFSAVETQMLWLFAQAKLYNVPLVIAGDIFDRAIADTRFLVFVYGLFQKCQVPVYAVPGNHDLPYHSYESVSESAYGVLTLLKSFVNIDPTLTYEIAGKTVTLHGFYWGKELSDPHACFNREHINIAVIHKYVYDESTGYFGADPANLYANQMATVQFPYDFLVYGDNHIPFSKTLSTGSQLINCGSFFRRSQNDKNLKPAAYLLKSDRTFETLFVPLEGQTFIQKDELVTVPTSGNLPDYSELSEFFAEQESFVDNLTIRDSLVRFVAMSKPPPAVKNHLARITGVSLE